MLGISLSIFWFRVSYVSPQLANPAFCGEEYYG